jgi:hypothetical protein
MPLKLLTDEQFTGDIWRMEIDELTGILFLETRDHTEKKVQFSAIDLSTGNILFKDLGIPERWLTGIEAAYDGVLLLHFYQTETGPAHKGLMALDAQTGLTIWTDYALSFDYLSENGPVVYDSRVHPRKLFLADIKTGATTRVYEPSVYKELKSSIVYPDLKETNNLPDHLGHKHPFGNTVHYLERNNFRIVSLHALKGGGLIQLLEVFDEAGLVYEDIMNSGIQKMQPEAFILYKTHLIYIKNRSELKVLSL